MVPGLKIQNKMYVLSSAGRLREMSSYLPLGKFRSCTVNNFHRYRLVGWTQGEWEAAVPSSYAGIGPSRTSQEIKRMSFESVNGVQFTMNEPIKLGRNDV